MNGLSKTVQTVKNKEAVLKAFDDGTKNIREVAGHVRISRTFVDRVMKSERQHRF